MTDELLRELREDPVWISKKARTQNPQMARCAAEMIYYTQLAPGFAQHKNTELLKLACERYIEAYNNFNTE